MPDRLLEAYETVPYESKPIHLSHASAIEVIARLHGLTPPPSARCRVLELGCASGGNVIAMAARLPNSQFVGIDLTPGQIAIGQETIEALGLRNISLHAMSLVDVTADFGMFDYIVCHGVYSWVPPEVQDAILRICSENLSPSGIAYVSYNIYPGWHIRGMARDMMAYHDKASLPPAERIARARTFIDTIAAAANQRSPHAQPLAREAEVLREQGDVYLLHEQLEPFNTPVYFAEFARRAAARRLRYVAEAKVSNGTEVPAWMSELLDGQSDDVVRVQQYHDFASGGTFRRTLLCHDTAVPNPKPDAASIRDFHLVMRAVPAKPSEEDARRSNGTAESFKSADDVVVTTNNPMVIAALHALLRVMPAALSFTELARRVDERLRIDLPPGFSDDGVNLHEGLEDAMFQCATGGLVELLCDESPFWTVISERPIAYPLARYRAEMGGVVPSLRHYAVEVSGLERLILMHLDGTTTRERLLELTENAILDGSLTTGNERPSREQLAAAIEAALHRFVLASLLEA